MSGEHELISNKPRPGLLLAVITGVVGVEDVGVDEAGGRNAAAFGRM